MVIGLCGYKGSGKSEVAKYIAEAYRFKRVNFKDALVEEIGSGFPDLLEEIIKIMDRTEYDGNNPWTVKRLFKDKPPLMRTLMQNYGTEVRREDNQNYWVDKWKQSSEFAGNIVADDVRFTNELLAVKDLGGIIIRVICGDILSDDKHASEKQQESFEVDFNILSKKGNLESLYHQIDGIMAHISAD